jgi:hypothetical protein
MSIKDRINIDIWILYGSFYYALESTLEEACGHDFLTLKIKAQNDSSTLPGDDEASKFLTEILHKPKSIVRMDLKVFGPDEFLMTHENFQVSAYPLFLYSEELPDNLSLETGIPTLKFRNLKSFLPGHLEAWEALIREI